MNTNRRKDKALPKIDSNAVLGVYGMVPPRAIEVEAAVLGGILLEKRAIEDVIGLLPGKEVFYETAHQHVWEAIEQLYRDNQPIDLMTVVDRLIKSKKLDEVGGPYGVTKLTMSVVTSANIQAHCHILLQKWMKREIGTLGSQMVSMSYDDALDDLEAVSLAEKRLMEIMSPLHKRTYTGMEGHIVDMMKRIENARANPDILLGVPSGYTALDNITKGWRGSDLIILAARPSVGKSAFMLNLARNAATNHFKPTKVGILSLEMSAGQLVERLVSAETEIWLEKIVTGKMDDGTMKQLYDKATKSIAKMPIVIDETASLNIFEAKSKIRKMVRDGVGLVMIDYLQLMSGLTSDRGQNREQEISTISRNLKVIAKELNIPIIALAQLSREVEKRKEGQNIPKLSDLRESGGIENDADVVMFLYRPEYHDIMSNEMGESTRGQTMLKIAKHRNGVLETINFQALLHIQKFVPAEPSVHQPLSASNVAGTNWAPIRKINEDFDDSPF
jgi:replicative DNA helicase